MSDDEILRAMLGDVKDTVSVDAEGGDPGIYTHTLTPKRPLAISAKVLELFLPPLDGSQDAQQPPAGNINHPGCNRREQRQ